MTAKIFRNAFLIGFTVLLACMLLFFFIMYSNYQAQAFDILQMEASQISEGMDICGGETYLSSIDSPERVTWIAADGSVLYDNMADPATMENHLQRPEVAEAFETGSGRSDRYSSTILEKNNYYALLLKDNTVLRVAGKQTSMAAMALMLVQPGLWIVVLVLVLCGLLAMRLAKQIVRPINAINPDNPNATPTYPELQPLISRLQEQNRTIRTQLSELSTRQREFDAITENMREGFLIVDDKCNILSSNRSALHLLGIDGNQKPENLHQATCSGAFLELVDEALGGTRGDASLPLDGGTWQLYANPVITGSKVTGAIVIFMDVTEREQREALRREFSANVSHELKTPLTSITGFAELMKEGMVPKEKMQEFSGDIYRESRRLIDLVDDIIQLSRLDEGTTTFTKTPVDLYVLAGNVIESLRPVAESRMSSCTCPVSMQSSPAWSSCCRRWSIISATMPSSTTRLAAASQSLSGRTGRPSRSPLSILASAFPTLIRAASSSASTGSTRATPRRSAAPVWDFPSSSTPRSITARSWSSKASRERARRSLSISTLVNIIFLILRSCFGSSVFSAMGNKIRFFSNCDKM